MSTMRSRLATWAANPMINKELRGRMRSGRSIIVLSIYLGLMAVFCVLFYWAIDGTAGLRNPYDQHLGRDLLYGIVTFETMLVAFLAPAFTVGAISGERERQTFDLLMTTLLRPRAIVLGKMGSALAFLLLLILGVAPLESLAFMFGGVSPDEIAGSLVVLAFAALLYGSIGFFWSSLMRSTVAATVLTYGTLLLATVGVPLVFYIVTAVASSGPNGSRFTSTPEFIYFAGVLFSSNPLIAMGFSEAFLRQGKSLFIFTDTSLVNGTSLLIVQPWLVFCILALIGSVILLMFSTRMLPPVRARRRQQQPGLPATEPEGAIPAPPLGTSYPAPAPGPLPGPPPGPDPAGAAPITGHPVRLARPSDGPAAAPPRGGD